MPLAIRRHRNHEGAKQRCPRSSEIVAWGNETCYAFLV